MRRIEKFAAEQGVSVSHARRCFLFANDVHALDAAIPGMKEKILNGEIKHSMSRAKEAAPYAKRGDTKTALDILYGRKTLIRDKGAIAKYPVYDESGALVARFVKEADARVYASVMDVLKEHT